jgi:hypothetical protein
LCILSSSDRLYFGEIDEADLVSTGGQLRVEEPRVLDPLPIAADRPVEHGKMPDSRRSLPVARIVSPHIVRLIP